MDQAISTSIWAVAIVIIAVIALLVFRVPLTALIHRTKKIGSGDKAIDFEQANELQQIQAEAQRAEPAAQIANHPLGPATPATAEIERKVVERLATIDESIEVRQQRLIRAFASQILWHDFEVIYRMSFGSQIELLLRTNAGGITEEAAREIFHNAKALFPQQHDGSSYDQWISFPANAGLVTRQDGRVMITARGKEFMQYLVQMGLTLPKSNG